MPLRVSNPSERHLLEILRSGWSVWIGLYDGPIEDDEAFDLARYLLDEASYDTYERQQVLTWSEPATDENGRAFTVGATVVFPVPSADLPEIHGWFATDSGAGGSVLWFAYNYAASFVYNNDSQALEVTVVFRFREDTVP